MYALRERRVHVTQEDFELAVAKVKIVFIESYFCRMNIVCLDHAKGFGEERVVEKALEVIKSFFCSPLLSFNLFALGLFSSVCYHIKSKKTNKSR